jgi:putative cardiolipin synthase
MTGHLIFKELRHAADHGVRVRLLLDDNGVNGLDEILAELAPQENIPIRLFNPEGSNF